jgi:8-oxo-dGTP pyrophosphatase MutT (NUDIX family)
VKADGQTRSQVAALPYRFTADGEAFVLLITSRETARWIIPKGWPMKGLKDHKAAAKEAFQEAGVIGAISDACLGTYEYWKRCKVGFELCEVRVFSLEVTTQASRWREKGQRELRWVGPEQAAILVQEPGLAALIMTFGRQHLGKKERKSEVA